MNYSFPRTKFVTENEVYSQMMHIKSEFTEMMDEYLTNPDSEAFVLEAMDGYHSYESLLRILEEKRGFNIAKVRRDAERKNFDRGYYNAD